MTIRKVILADLKLILELNLKLFQFERAFGNTYSLDWTYSQVGRNYFKKRLTENNGIVFLAQDKQEAIGYICGYSFKDTARIPPLMAEIENMFVEESWRRKGIGQKLVAAFETEAKKRGVKRIKVDALIENSVGRRFYEKQQFHPHAIIYEKEI